MQCTKLVKHPSQAQLMKQENFSHFLEKLCFHFGKAPRQSTISLYRKDELISVSKWLAKFWHCRFKVFKCSIFSTSVESSFTKKENLSASLRTRPERSESSVFSLFAISFIILFISSMLKTIIFHTLSRHHFPLPDSCQGYIPLLTVF